MARQSPGKAQELSPDRQLLPARTSGTRAHTTLAEDRYGQPEFAQPLYNIVQDFCGLRLLAPGRPRRLRYLNRPAFETFLRRSFAHVESPDHPPKRVRRPV